jgi:hypothetical protein
METARRMPEVFGALLEDCRMERRANSRDGSEKVRGDWGLDEIEDDASVDPMRESTVRKAFELPMARAVCVRNTIEPMPQSRRALGVGRTNWRRQRLVPTEIDDVRRRFGRGHVANGEALMIDAERRAAFSLDADVLDSEPPLTKNRPSGDARAENALGVTDHCWTT